MPYPPTGYASEPYSTPYAAEPHSPVPYASDAYPPAGYALEPYSPAPPAVGWDPPAPIGASSWEPPVPTLAPAAAVSIAATPWDSSAPAPSREPAPAPRVSWDLTTTSRAVLARPFVVSQSDDPPAGRLLGFTASWIVGPTALYLIWSLLFGEHRGAIVDQFVGGLPWILTAMVLSFAIAMLLRWGVAGWRAGILGFAAAVIGGGVATLAHSLTL